MTMASVVDMHVWRMSRRLVDEYERYAPYKADKQADACFEAGDPIGEQWWLSVREAVIEAQIKNGARQDCWNG